MPSWLIPRFHADFPGFTLKIEVSPTTSVLGKLCAAYGLTMSRLMHLVEDDFVPLVRQSAQLVWTDQTVGFRRRSVSPPAHGLAAEVLECELDPGMRISYDGPPRPGLEHHLLLIEGQLEVSVDERTYDLRPGDCLRYQLFGPSAFVTSEQCSAKYILSELVTLLQDAVASGASVGFLPPLSEEEAREYWTALLEDIAQKKRVLLIARHATQVVGAVQLELATKANAQHRAEVQKLFVLQPERRRGIGRLLMGPLNRLRVNVDAPY